MLFFEFFLFPHEDGTLEVTSLIFKFLSRNLIPHFDPSKKDTIVFVRKSIVSV